MHTLLGNRPAEACWVALHLPDLALEACAATLGGMQAGRPLALLQAGRIAAADSAARALGVQPGQRRATAVALAPALLLCTPQPRQQAQALRAVAHAALAFTPVVSLDGADAVLLEASSTLRLFGGLPRLGLRLRAALAPLGHRLQWACAPTPAGAALLARAPSGPAADGDPEALAAPSLTQMRSRLDHLPLALLCGEPALRERLQAMGLHTLGALRTLPRDGLARRCGPALLELIDRARGQAPDPRTPVQAPAVFDERLELFARADTSAQLMHGAERLLARLLAWAHARQGRVPRLALVAHHEAHHRADAALPESSTLVLALAQPSADAAHLSALLRERLARWVLPAPAHELSLRCEGLVHAPPPSGELFPGREAESAQVGQLLERLQARLGERAVLRLRCHADHRPERATQLDAAAGPPRAVAKATADPSPGLGLTRPVWLLQPAQRLAERLHPPGQGQPLLDGRPLQLLAGPERIESGWWDEAPAVRDYFIARAGDGALVWIYRTRAPLEGPQAGWFLQGRFG